MSFTTLPNEKPTLGEAQILSHGPMRVVVGYEITDNGGEAKAEPKADIYSLGKVIADMAKATGDKNLQKMATIYTIPDTHRRPDTIEKLRKQPSPRRRQLATRANARCDSVHSKANQVMDYQLWNH